MLTLHRLIRVGCHIIRIPAVVPLILGTVAPGIPMWMRTLTHR